MKVLTGKQDIVYNEKCSRMYTRKECTDGTGVWFHGNGTGSQLNFTALPTPDELEREYKISTSKISPEYHTLIQKWATKVEVDGSVIINLPEGLDLKLATDGTYSTEMRYVPRAVSPMYDFKEYIS